MGEKDVEALAWLALEDARQCAFELDCLEAAVDRLVKRLDNDEDEMEAEWALIHSQPPVSSGGQSAITTLVHAYTLLVEECKLCNRAACLNATIDPKMELAEEKATEALLLTFQAIVNTAPERCTQFIVTRGSLVRDTLCVRCEANLPSVVDSSEDSVLPWHGRSTMCTCNELRACAHALYAALPHVRLGKVPIARNMLERLYFDAEVDEWQVFLESLCADQRALVSHHALALLPVLPHRVKKMVKRAITRSAMSHKAGR
jgi:hypothetical protein